MNNSVTKKKNQERKNKFDFWHVLYSLRNLKGCKILVSECQNTTKLCVHDLSNRWGASKLHTLKLLQTLMILAEYNRTICQTETDHLITRQRLSTHELKFYLLCNAIKNTVFFVFICLRVITSQKHSSLGNSSQTARSKSGFVLRNNLKNCSSVSRSAPQKENRSKCLGIYTIFTFFHIFIKINI